MKLSTQIPAARFIPSRWILSLLCFLTLQISAPNASVDGPDKTPHFILEAVFTDQAPAIGVYVGKNKPILFLITSETEIKLDGNDATIESLSDAFYGEYNYYFYFTCRVQSDGKNLKYATKIQVIRHNDYGYYD